MFDYAARGADSQRLLAVLQEHITQPENTVAGAGGQEMSQSGTTGPPSIGQSPISVCSAAQDGSRSAGLSTRCSSGDTLNIAGDTRFLMSKRPPIYLILWLSKLGTGAP
jgi:hypothetical protein